jgi:hypothetical protein
MRHSAAAAPGPAPQQLRLGIPAAQACRQPSPAPPRPAPPPRPHPHQVLKAVDRLLLVKDLLPFSEQLEALPPGDLSGLEPVVQLKQQVGGGVGGGVGCRCRCCGKGWGGRPGHVAALPWGWAARLGPAESLAGWPCCCWCGGGGGGGGGGLCSRCPTCEAPRSSRPGPGARLQGAAGRGGLEHCIVLLPGHGQLM